MWIALGRQPASSRRTRVRGSSCRVRATRMRLHGSNSGTRCKPADVARSSCLPPGSTPRSRGLSHREPASSSRTRAIALVQPAHRGSPRAPELEVAHFRSWQVLRGVRDRGLPASARAAPWSHAKSCAFPGRTSPNRHRRSEAISRPTPGRPGSSFGRDPRRRPRPGPTVLPAA